MIRVPFEEEIEKKRYTKYEQHSSTEFDILQMCV